MIAKTNQSSVRLKECMARATYVFMHVISSKPLEAYEGDFGQNPDLHLQDGGCNRYLACLSTDNPR